jgi:hypothetical protein
MKSETIGADKVDRLQASCELVGTLGVLFFGLQLLLLAGLFLLALFAREVLAGFHGGAGHLSVPWAAATGGVALWAVTKFALALRLRQFGAMLAYGEPKAWAKLRYHAIGDIVSNAAFAGVGLLASAVLVLRGDLNPAPGMSLASLLGLITVLMLIFPARVLRVLSDAGVAKELARRGETYEHLLSDPDGGPR